MRVGDLGYGVVNLVDTLVERHGFCITVNKKNVTGIEVECCSDTAGKVFRRSGEPAKVRPSPNDRH